MLSKFSLANLRAISDSALTLNLRLRRRDEDIPIQSAYLIGDKLYGGLFMNIEAGDRFNDPHGNLYVVRTVRRLTVNSVSLVTIQGNDDLVS